MSKLDVLSFAIYFAVGLDIVQGILFISLVFVMPKVVHTLGYRERLKACLFILDNQHSRFSMESIKRLKLFRIVIRTIIALTLVRFILGHALMKL